jgi:hypothetical protein
LIKEANPSSVMVHLFQPYVKTNLRAKAVEMNLISQDYLCGDYRINAIGTGFLSADDLYGLQRTFNLYVSSPRKMWNKIREAELLTDDGNKIFAQLAREYQLVHFNRTSFGG